jgi:pimeloyl-ACP methyl ester carboxylesterase
VHLAAAGHPTYALDFRGHGLSERPDDGYDLSVFAADTTAVLNAIADRGADPVVAGHSLGARVLLELLSTGECAPRMAGAALVEGGLAGATSQFDTWEKCLASMALAPVEGLPAAAVRGFLAGRNPGWSVDRLEAAMACFDVGVQGTSSWRLSRTRFESLLAALWAEDLPAGWTALGSVGIPALFVAADTRDVRWSEAKAEASRRLVGVVTQASVEWLGHDHDVPLAEPVALASLLLQLDSLTTAPHGIGRPNLARNRVRTTQ